MIQVRRTSLWFAFLAMLFTVVFVSTGVPLNALSSLIAFDITAWFVYLINVRCNKADRKMQENYRDQICWLEMNGNLVEDVKPKRYKTPGQGRA